MMKNSSPGAKNSMDTKPLYAIEKKNTTIEKKSNLFH